MSNARPYTNSVTLALRSGALALLLASLLPTDPASAQEPNNSRTTPPGAIFLADRGTGIATSMFGTYVRDGEWLIYPFLEHYRDRNFEYKPTEFGGTREQDYRGRFRAFEGLFMVAHGLTDDLAFEIEAAVIHASFERAVDDPSALPRTFTESELGDVEGQLRWGGRVRPSAARSSSATPRRWCRIIATSP